MRNFAWSKSHPAVFLPPAIVRLFRDQQGCWPVGMLTQQPVRLEGKVDSHKL
jgi:hypothetical protein